ncbi:hypothetical protein GGI23_003449, partial [Coemansia sp. RSA 2559]
MFDHLVIAASFLFSFLVGWIFLAHRVLESVDVSTPVSGPPETAKSAQLATAMLKPIAANDGTAPLELQPTRRFDAQRALVYGVFSLVIAQGSVLFELIILEISGVLDRDLRWYFWRADL